MLTCPKKTSSWVLQMTVRRYLNISNSHFLLNSQYNAEHEWFRCSLQTTSIPPNPRNSLLNYCAPYILRRHLQGVSLACVRGPSPVPPLCVYGEHQTRPPGLSPAVVASQWQKVTSPTPTPTPHHHDHHTHTHTPNNMLICADCMTYGCTCDDSCEVQSNCNYCASCWNVCC